jgi:subtilisin family serine protease
VVKWWQAGRAGLALILAGVVGSGLTSGASMGAAPHPPPSQAQPASGPTVTLITGDRVLLGRGAGLDEVSVQRGKGREDMPFRRYTKQGDLYVEPADAARLVSSGVLDRRLFNVTKLVEFGYHDGARPDLPLIVDHAAGSRRAVAAGATATRELPSIDATAVRQDKRTAGEFWQRLGAANQRGIDGVERILLDGPVRAALAESVPQIEAPAAWRAGHTGAGVAVAVLDTGIDAEHPDLADAVLEARDFTESPSGTDDRYGHGTHVASTITGSGAASGGRYAGVAPDAGLVIGKVLGDTGEGTETMVVAGMEWAARRARVVNMSLGSPWPSDGTDSMSQAVDRLTAETGALFVVAAGNSGPHEETIGSPAAADSALTVGAVDKQDALAEFSSRGPRAANGAIKPDITAPGVDIVAAKARNGSMGDPVGDWYTTASGTSMAAPHVAGAAAILAAQRPNWRATQLKAALMGSATPADGPTVYGQGAGRVDLARATTQTAYATPASVSGGLVPWPHEDDTPVEATVTYHNDGSEPLTLDLALGVRDGSGNAAPDGMFTLSARQVTVPAGGTASVTLTTDTRTPAPDGAYSGVLVASGNGATVRTPVGVVREDERYELRLSLLDGHGAPGVDNLYDLWGIDTDHWYFGIEPSGTITMRLPKGRYVFVAQVSWSVEGERRPRTAYFAEPTIQLDADVAMVFDSRTANPISLTAASRPDARSVGNSVLEFQRRTAAGNPTGVTWSVSHFDGVSLHPSVTSADEPGAFTVTARTRLARPDGAGGFANTPYAYHLGWQVDRRVPAELPRGSFADPELAAVPARYAAGASKGPDQRASLTFGDIELSLPATVTHYFAPDLAWGNSLFLGPTVAEHWASIGAVQRTYSRRDRTPERWGMAVFGPAFPVNREDAGPWAGRYRDELAVAIPTFTDQAANHYGHSQVDSGRTELYRDGVKLAESAMDGGLGATVPPEPGTYRLHTEAVRTSYSELSTTVTVDWTFRSQHVTGPSRSGGVKNVMPPEFQPLSLMAVRFAPSLDDWNQAPAGRRFALPVYVQQQRGASFGRLNELSVQASFDDGATWQPVRLHGHGLQRFALVDHPRGAGFVSLKATAADSNGNRVEQTIVRAYKLRAP